MTLPEIEEAYERAWLVLQSHAGDKEAVKTRLAQLVVTYGRHHPDASPEMIARAVLKMFLDEK